jgi:nucleoside-diphosphate-sugar epimerase
MKHILLTGSSGFIGKRFVIFNQNHYKITTVSLRTKNVQDIEWKGIDAVIHLAGMAHQMKKIEDQIYFDVNLNLTKELANAAKTANIKHFIFASTIKVFGEHHTNVLTEQTACEPQNDPYGESKLQAERYLQSIETDTFKVALVRPPLVYGPGVKGNLIRFLELANKPFPLPFDKIDNRRTMVFLDNLIALINQIIDTESSGLFLAGDSQPLSTTQLIKDMRNGLGKSPNLFVMPAILVKALRSIRPSLAIRLYGSLEMDTTNTNKNLNFVPPFTTQEGIQSMVNWYKEE